MSYKEEDVFHSDSKKKEIDNLKETLLIPNGKDSIDFLFYALCYAVRYKKVKKTEKCSDEELKNDLPNDLFVSLDSIRTQLVLDLD